MTGKPEYLSSRDLAARWGISEKTLRHWRCDGKGPPYSKFGGRVRYKISDVEAFEAQATVDA